MKVLTIGPTPYLLSKKSKIHSDILFWLASKGVQPISLSWHHDPTWFMPEDDGKHYFEKEGHKVCEIIPIENIAEISVQIYETINELKPDIVLSVGTIDEVAPIGAVKMMESDFKWVSILSVDSTPINENKIEQISYMDEVIVTNKRASIWFAKKCPEINCHLIKYGHDNRIFNTKDRKLKDDGFWIINADKNTTSANLGAFIEGVVGANRSNPEIKGYLHSNVYDVGDYDIEYLIESLGGKDVIFTPEKFIGLNEGLPALEWADLLKSHHAFVDCSVQSSTSLKALEAAACGLFVITPTSNAHGDIHTAEIASDWCKYYNYFAGDASKLAIVDSYSLTFSITKAYEAFKENSDQFLQECEEKSKKAHLYANNFKFTNAVEEVCRGILENNSLNVQNFS